VSPGAPATALVERILLEERAAAHRIAEHFDEALTTTLNELSTT